MICDMSSKGNTFTSIRVILRMFSGAGGQTVVGYCPETNETI